MKVGFPIRWLVGQLHVSTPYQEIADDISARAAAAAEPITGRSRSRFITQACIAHHQNRRIYDAVMRGDLR